jgi:hypothetical protein
VRGGSTRGLGGAPHFDHDDGLALRHLTSGLQKARRIAANGEDPAEYVEISYRISETKFNAWPETLKSAFEAARTVKSGKPSYRLALVKE